MTFYYWKGASGSAQLLEQHKASIDRILAGDYSARDLKKLKCSLAEPVYRFKLNDTERILFTRHRGYLHILDYLPTHDYHKSRFLRKGVLKAAIESFDTNEDVLFLNISEEEKPVFKAPISQTVGLDYYNQKFFSLSEAQQAVIHQRKFPMLLNGVAGTGKTYVGLSLLLAAHEDGAKRLLYVSKESNLVRQMHQNWTNGFAVDAEEAVEFKTYAELFPELPASEVLSGQFINWFNTLKLHDWLELRSAEEVYREFRVCSGFSCEAYANLGHRQSAISYKHRTEFYQKIYERYLEIGYSEFSQITVDEEYDVILVDEAQNLTLAQLGNLVTLAKNQQIIFCMDSHQNIFDTHSFRILLEQSFRNKGNALHQTVLRDTYRYSSQVARVLDRIIEFGRIIQGGVLDKQEALTMTINPTGDEGEFILLTPEKVAKEADWLLKRAQSTELAVVTTATCLEEARDYFKTPLVFTPEQIIGQEFHTIVCYKLLTSAQAIETLKDNYQLFKEGTPPVPKNLPKTADKQSYRYTPWLHQYFIANSRAVFTLVSVEQRTKINPYFLDLLSRGVSYQSPTEVKLAENWSSMAEEQAARGNTHISTLIHQREEKPLVNMPSNNSFASNNLSLFQKKSPNSKKKSNDTPKAPDLGRLSPPSSSMSVTEARIIWDAFKQLMLAINEDNTSEVETLLDRKNLKLNINQVDLNLEGNGDTPLMRAARIGSAAMVKLLLQQPEIDINYVSYGTNATAFLVAASRGKEEIIQLFLQEKKLDINQTLPNGMTALMMASHKGHTDVVKLLVRQENILLNLIERQQGFTALMHAVSNQHVEVVEFLLQQKELDILYTNNQGGSAFWLALGFKNIPIIRLFLNNNEILEKIDINQFPGVTQFNKIGLTAFEYTILWGDLPSTELFLEYKQQLKLNINHYSPEAGVTPLKLAIAYNRIEVIKLLLAEENINTESILDFVDAMLAEKNPKNDQARDHHTRSDEILCALLTHKNILKEAIRCLMLKTLSDKLLHALPKNMIDISRKNSTVAEYIWLCLKTPEPMNLSLGEHQQWLTDLSRHSKSTDLEKIKQRHPLFKVLILCNKEAVKELHAITEIDAPLEEASSLKPG